MVFVSYKLLNFSWVCSTPKLSKYVTWLRFTFKAILWAPITHQDLLYMSYPLLGKLFFD